MSEEKILLGGGDAGADRGAAKAQPRSIAVPGLSCGKGNKRREEQSRAEQSRAEQSRAEQSRAEQTEWRREKSRVE
jgi:hypothetical protein